MTRCATAASNIAVMAPSPWSASRLRHCSHPSTAWAIDQQDLLYVAVVGRCVEELLERGEQIERIVPFVHDGRRGEVGLDLIEDGPGQQVFLVHEVMVEGATGADLGLGDDLLCSRRRSNPW